MAGRSAGEIAFEITGDTSRLGAKIERDLTRATSAVNRQIQRNLSTSLAGIRPAAAPWTALSGAVATLNTETKRAAASFAQLEAAKARALSAGQLPTLTANTRAASGAASSLGSEFGIVGSRMQALPLSVISSLTHSLEAAAGSVLALGTAIATVGLKSASTLQDVDLGINSISSHLKDINAESTVSAMRDLSVASGVSLREVGKATQAFVLMGSTGKESLAIVKAEMDGLAAAGALTGDSFNYVSKAIRQIGSKPFLQLEELNQIAEHIPVSRGQVIKQIAKNTGDSIAEVQKRFKDGTQQGGDALTAVIQQIKALDVSGKALENRAKTIGGAFAIAKNKIQLALGDIFKPLATQLATELNNINFTQIAMQVGEPIRNAMAQLVPTLVRSLPDIINGIVLGFKIMIPIVSAAVRGMASFASIIIDHQDEIQSAISSIGDFLGGIIADLKAMAPEFEPVIVQIGFVIKLLGGVGQALEFIAPVFKYVGKVAAFAFNPFISSIDIVLHGIEQLLEGIGLVPHNIPIFGSMAAGADNAAAKIHNLRNELTSLGNAATTVRTGWEQDAASITKILNDQGFYGKGPSGPPDFKLPVFPNTGGVAPDSGAKAAADKAKRLAEAYADSLKGVLKDLNEYMKNIGNATISQIQNNFDRAVDGLREARDKAKEAGRKGTAAAIQAQIKQFRDANKRLLDLAKKRDAINDKLTAAKDALKTIKDESADFVKTMTDNIKALGNVTNDTGGIRTTFIGIRRQLRNAVNDTRQFAVAINQLRALGLNETSLRQLAEAGPQEGLAAAKAIARQGAAGVAELNSLQKSLEQTGSSIANGLNTQFYAAGIQAASGLVKGLQSQEAALVAAMDSLADKLVKAIKKKLKIASPSGVFADEVGAMIPEGTAKGIYKKMRTAEQASQRLANQTIINFGANAVSVSGVQDRAMAQKTGVYAGQGIADVIARRAARAQLAGER